MPEIAMRRFAVLTIVALACAAAAVQTASAQNRARSEALDMEDKDRALVSKESIKAQRDKRNNERQNRGKSSGKDEDCGKVDIGNDDDKKGSSRIAERQKTVIITGNIINNANCR
jgi:hypothetical protein